MRIYQYIFYYHDDGSIRIIHGTDLCDVNKRAYKLYLEEWDEQNADLKCFNNTKLSSLCEFCSKYNTNDGLFYGGFRGNYGLDIIRYDIIVDTEEIK